MRYLFVICLALAQVLLARAAEPVEPQSVRKPRALTFQLAEQILRASSVEVANGIVIRKEDWPTLIVASMLEEDKSCTGTFVGPSTIFTAAHCVDSPSGEPRQTQMLVSITLVPLVCEMHPDYLSSPYVEGGTRNSHDYALCFIDTKKKFASLKKLQFEVIDAEAPLSAKDPIMFTGYGCEKLTVSIAGQLSATEARGKLTIGDVKVDSPANSWASEVDYLTIRSNPAKDPAICPGDSGGPLFSGVSAAKVAEGKMRRIRGVNSRVCTQLRDVNSTACASFAQAGTWDVISSISVTGTERFRDWANTWIARHDDTIVCGINQKAGALPCRQ